MKKIVYLGSPDFSAYLLEQLSNLNIKIVGVVTQKDKPVGRKKQLTPTQVKKTALRLKLPVFEFEAWEQNIMDVLSKSDLAVVYAFGAIIPKKILDLPKFGFINIHPSLLPRFRGASPVVYPLALGETETGITIIKMDEKMDHGPIIFQAKTKILEEESKQELYFKLTRIAFEGLKKILTGDLNSLKFKNQDHKKATYTKILKREDGFIEFQTLLSLEKGEKVKANKLPRFLKEYLEKYPFEKPQSLTLFNLYRALHPWPGIWTIINFLGKEKRLKITEVKLEGGKSKITKVQLEGKRETEWENYKNLIKNSK